MNRRTPFRLGGLLLLLWALPVMANPGQDLTGWRTYVVTADIPTLSEISTYLYGTCKMSGQLAQWNHLSLTDRLHVGQKLRLETPPRITPEQGDLALLEMWRKRFHVSDDSARFPASVKQASPAPAQKPAPQYPTESPVLF